MADLVVELLSRRPALADDDQPERLQTLLELLDRPDHAAPTIWVTGSHGRSSVLAMVTALLSALDITVGTVTTPHLQDLRERLRLAGAAIPADTLRAQLAYLDPFLAEVDTRFGGPLTFDEVLFALAATWFADIPVDATAVEADPLPTGRSDVLVTMDATEPATVRASDGTVTTAGTDFGVVRTDVAVGGQRVTLHGMAGKVADIYLPLHGRHQADNAAVALAVIDGFLGSEGGVDPELIRQAFARLRLPGRMEVVRRTDRASVVLDAAHDAAGAAALATALRDEFTVRHRIGVLGACDDDPHGFATTMAAAADHVVIVPAPTPTSASVDHVADAARRAGVPVEIADTVDAAIEQASGVATVNDLVVVTGCAATVGAARRALSLDPVDELIDRA